MTRRRGDRQLWQVLVTQWCPKLHTGAENAFSSVSAPGGEEHTAPPFRDRAGVSQEPGAEPEPLVYRGENQAPRSSRTCPRVKAGSRLPTGWQSFGFLGKPGAVFGGTQLWSLGQEMRPQDTHCAE